jgi:hypothetical protein
VPAYKVQDPEFKPQYAKKQQKLSLGHEKLFAKISNYNNNSNLKPCIL